MKSRAEFSEKLIRLLYRMVEEGEHPLIDYVKRSDEDQYRLFKEGL